MIRLPAALRTSLLAAAVLALAASANSRSSAPPPQPAAGGWNAQPPAAQAMDPRSSHGLWKSTFGAVKIEEAAPGQVHGVWTYDRQGTQVVGYFAGPLEGNVLRLTWREPGTPVPGAVALEGEGWLVFDPAGQRFNGRWWTHARDRQGDWSGWRGAPAAQPVPGMGVEGYGGQGYGGAPTYPPPPPRY